MGEKSKNLKLENCCDSAENLSEYLKIKGRNHNYYKCYSLMERAFEIKDKKKLYLSDGSTWNDIDDRKDFNCRDSGFVNFGKSFSFSKDENVAMWMLYGGINKLGGMIDFTKKGINEILKTASVDVGYFRKDESGKVQFQKVTEVSSKDFKIYATDVIYYDKNKNKNENENENENGSAYYINRSDEAFRRLPKEILEKMNGCKKSYSWSYESECRLIVSIDKNLLNDECKFVCIDLENMNLGKSLERLYRGPNYPSYGPYIKEGLESYLTGTIDWNLCDKEKCIYEKEK